MPGRPALGHPDPPDRRACARRWRTPRSATTSSARTPRSARSRSEVADLLGHEAGLFTPTGSMANQLGVRLHVAPGEELVADRWRTCCAPSSGPLRCSPASPVADRGRASAACSTPPDRLSLVITGVGALPGRHRARRASRTPTTSAAARCSRSTRSARCGRPPRSVGVAMHLDGARLWNAHVASGVALARLRHASSTRSRVCLTKGLGAPVGSVLVGSVGGDGRGAHLAQALRRRDATGRHPRGGGPATRSTTTSSGSPTTTRGRARCGRGVRRGVTGIRRRRHGRDQHRRARRVRGRVDGSRSGGRALDQGVRIYAVGPGAVPAGLAPRRLRRGDGCGDRRGVGTAAVRAVGHSCVKLVRPDSTRI